MSRWVLIIFAGVLVCILAACQGGNSPDPTGFDKLSARLVDAEGQPLAGVSVRVEGQDTGVVTDANGNFELEAEAFPNGAGNENEVSFGKGGVVFGSETVVPADADGGGGGFLFEFAPSDPNGTASLSGTIYDETTSAVVPAVEVALFSVDGGVYVTQTDFAGHYAFESLAAGDWQLAAYKDGYYPEMSFVHIEDGAAVVQDLALTPRGGIVPGEGLIVKGVLTDAKTGAPVAGATVTLYADTGYLGIAEDGLYDDVQDAAGGNAREGSMMPYYYDPQYQETTTQADGSFEFENGVIGYSIWMNMYADGYLNGSYYQSIDGLEGEISLNLAVEPIIPTDISGRVVDEYGTPIQGAYVEFVYGMDGGVLVGMDVPGGIDVEVMAEQSQATREETNGTPPPPAAGGVDDADGVGWDDYGEISTGGGTGNEAGSDNILMQQYLYQNRQGHSGSAAEPFNGYFSATTDENGEYSFEDVPAGTYYVFASAYRHLTYNAEFTAQEDPAQNELEIVLANIPVGAVEGIITDEQGEPVPDTLVTCTQPNVDPFTYTDANGHYLIENVPTGDWIVSAYKQGYLTVGVNTPILEDQTVEVNITINDYEAPEQEMVLVSGRLSDGTDNAGIAGADMVFTPVDNELGGDYYRHVTTGADGSFNTDLINNGEYNLLIQKEGYEDLYVRIWVDANWPQLEFMLWPVGAGSGSWGGMVPGRPPVDDGGGTTDPGTGGGGTTEPGDDDVVIPM